MADRRRVPRIGRVLDVVAALVFLSGAASYTVSWLGLRGMDGFVRPEGADTFAAVRRADELSRLGRIGIGLMIGAVIIGIAAAIIARRKAAREA